MFHASQVQHRSGCNKTPAMLQWKYPEDTYNTSSKIHVSETDAPICSIIWPVIEPHVLHCGTPTGHYPMPPEATFCWTQPVAPSQWQAFGHEPFDHTVRNMYQLGDNSRIAMHAHACARHMPGRLPCRAERGFLPLFEDIEGVI
jgi:hypothetical protein